MRIHKSFETAFALALVAAGLILAGFVLAQPASASSVSYVGPDGNVWLASPDGTINTRVTTDGSTTSPWRSPTQRNDGTIAALRSGTNFVTFFSQSG